MLAIHVSCKEFHLVRKTNILNSAWKNMIFAFRIAHKTDSAMKSDRLNCRQATFRCCEKGGL